MKQSLRRLTAGGLALCFALSLTALPALADDTAAPDASVTTAEATPASGDNTEVLPPEDPGSEPEQPAEEPSEEPGTPQTIATTWTSAHVRYLGGYEDRSVRPERQVTRAEAAAIVYRLLEDPEAGTGSCSYGDVNDSDWFAINVRALCRLGLFDDSTAFRPNEPITRAEMVDLLTRLAPETAVTVSFSDVPADYWA